MRRSPLQRDFLVLYPRGACAPPLPTCQTLGYKDEELYVHLVFWFCNFESKFQLTSFQMPCCIVNGCNVSAKLHFQRHSKSKSRLIFFFIFAYKDVWILPVKCVTMYARNQKKKSSKFDTNSCHHSHARPSESVC